MQSAKLFLLGMMLAGSVAAADGAPAVVPPAPVVLQPTAAMPAPAGGVEVPVPEAKSANTGKPKGKKAQGKPAKPKVKPTRK